MMSWLGGLGRGHQSAKIGRQVSMDGKDIPSCKWGHWLGIGLVVLGVACRLQVYLLRFPIWGDEAMLALNFVSRDFRGLVCELDNYQVAPILFLWIEKAVFSCGGVSEQLLRLVPLLAGLLGLLLFYRLTRLCLTALEAALAVGCMAMAWSPIHLASQIKPYSIDLCLAALLLYLAVGYLNAPERKRYLAALTLLIPFAVAASYPVVFVAGAVSLVLLPVVWRRGGLSGQTWLLAFNLLCVTAFLAHLRLVGHQAYDSEAHPVMPYMASYWKNSFLPYRPLPALHWILRCHVGHMLSYPLPWNGGGLLGLVLAVAGGHALHRRGQCGVVCLCVLPFALNFLAGALHCYPYAGDQRLEQGLVPGLCLLLGAGAGSLIQRLTGSVAWQIRWTAGVAAVLVLVGLVGAVKDILSPTHDEEAAWARDIARHLQRELHPQDQLLLCQPEGACLPCLRWQLLRFQKHMCSPLQIDWQRLERSGGRLWVVDHDEELALETAVLPIHDLKDRLPGLEQPPWHAVRHTFFRAKMLEPCKQKAYHYVCAVHVLEGPASANTQREEGLALSSAARTSSPQASSSRTTWP